MGAASFYETSSIADPHLAYQDLCRKARDEHGSDVYNGRINNSGGFTVVSKAPMAQSAANQFASDRLEELSKWGPCEVIAVGKPSKTKKRTITFQMPIDTRENYLRVELADIAKAAGVDAALIANFTILESSPKYKTSTRKAGPVRRFWTTSKGGEFATRAEAVAFAKRHIERADASRANFSPSASIQREEELTVRQVIAHSPEAALVRTLTAWKVKVEVEVANGPLAFSHWMFYGVVPY